MSADEDYMRAALAMGRRGLGCAAPNPSVGCIIVKKNMIVGRGVTAIGGRPHAEASALRQAGHDARGATAYVTLEPCAVAGREGPCAQALINAGIARVVIGCMDINPAVNGRGIEILKNAGIDVSSGVLEAEAHAVHQGFFLRFTNNRPMITLKAATTQDGFIEPEAGTPWITGELARHHVHLERSLHDAILVGIGTVMADDPVLTTRLPGFVHKGVRIILDSHLKIPLESRLVRSAGDTPLWVFHKDDPADRRTALEQMGVKIMSAPDLKTAMGLLAGQGITRVLVEGGPAVWDSFIRAGLYDRLLLYRSPRVAGHGPAAFANYTIDSIGPALGLRAAGRRELGQDLLEIYEK